MPRMITNQSSHLIVYPECRHSIQEAGYPSEARAVCEYLARTLRSLSREVASVDVVSTRDLVCSYCGSPWTEDDAMYNGGCCDKDLAHDPTSEAEVDE